MHCYSACPACVSIVYVLTHQVSLLSLSSERTVNMEFISVGWMCKMLTKLCLGNNDEKGRIPIKELAGPFATLDRRKLFISIVSVAVTEFT